MTTLPGRWALSMRTPIGSIAAEMTFFESDGTLGGKAIGKDETVPLTQIHTEQLADGELVTWSQAITKPMRLNLDFEVVITGDEMNGFSKAGRLPRSSVTGRRLRTA